MDIDLLCKAEVSYASLLKLQCTVKFIKKKDNLLILTVNMFSKTSFASVITLRGKHKT